VFSDKAVLMYLKESGYNAAATALLGEATLSTEVREDESAAGMLEKKWTSIIRLQKKVCTTPLVVFIMSCS
jgi:hypothetical protein